MKLIMKSATIDEFDEFNMCSGSDNMKSLVGRVVVVTGAAVMEDPDDEQDEFGNRPKYNYFKLDDGSYVSGSSVVINKMMGALIDRIEEIGEQKVEIKEIASGKGKALVVLLRK